MRLRPNADSFPTFEETAEALWALRDSLQGRNKSHCRESCACGPCHAARLVQQAQEAIQPDLNEERRLRAAGRAERSES